MSVKTSSRWVTHTQRDFMTAVNMIRVIATRRKARAFLRRKSYLMSSWFTPVKLASWVYSCCRESAADTRQSESARVMEEAKFIMAGRGVSDCTFPASGTASSSMFSSILSRKENKYNGHIGNVVVYLTSPSLINTLLTDVLFCQLNKCFYLCQRKHYSIQTHNNLLTLN